MSPPAESDVQGLVEEASLLLAEARAVATFLVARVPAARTEAGAPGDGTRDGHEGWPEVAEWLRDSVVRPLAAALEPDGAAGAPEVESRLDRPGRTAVERLCELAATATRALGRSWVLPRHPGHADGARVDTLAEAVAEATAALQRLAVGLTPPQRRAARTEELAELQAGVPAGIRVHRDGPYLLTGVERLTDHLGVRLPTLPTMALCRCGESGRKPWCDGSHARVGFSGAKDPTRVPDRRDSYRGVGVTVLDNRGICQHSGFCTDRLPEVFHADAEPFVTPSGARVDDIMTTVRSCPSGALSFAVDGGEAREQVDQAGRPPQVEVSKDGPYRVTGGLALTDSTGHDEPRAAGASGEHYALCRCGHSRNKPFCSGMHFYIGFEDPAPPDQPSLFEWAGGFPALLRMTRLFYTKYVPADELLAPLFASMSADHPERVAAWLGEVFGGPAAYSEQYGGYSRMISQHMGRQLTEAQRSRWVALLTRAAAEAGLPQDPEFAAAFVAYLEWGSRIAVENAGAGARPPVGMPVPRWWWVCEATPGARASALAPETEPEPDVVPPGPGEPVSFAAHIRPLFRQRDRGAMRFAFDLWSHADVAAHADAILARLRDGSMPCDGAWPRTKIALFERWITAGSPR